MIKYLYNVIGLCLISTITLAQVEIYKFGQFSDYEVTLNQYDKDPEAEAIILFDIGASTFFLTDRGYDIRFKRKKRIKILSKSVPPMPIYLSLSIQMATVRLNI